MRGILSASAKLDTAFPLLADSTSCIICFRSSAADFDASISTVNASAPMSAPACVLGSTIALAFAADFGEFQTVSAFTTAAVGNVVGWIGLDPRPAAAVAAWPDSGGKVRHLAARTTGSTLPRAAHPATLVVSGGQTEPDPPAGFQDGWPAIRRLSTIAIHRNSGLLDRP